MKKKLKKKNLIIISVNAERFDKIQHSFLIKKKIRKLGTEGNLFSFIKVMYGKPTANVFSL